MVASVPFSLCPSLLLSSTSFSFCVFPPRGMSFEGKFLYTHWYRPMQNMIVFTDKKIEKRKIFHLYTHAYTWDSYSLVNYLQEQSCSTEIDKLVSSKLKTFYSKGFSFNVNEATDREKNTCTSYIW